MSPIGAIGSNDKTHDLKLSQKHKRNEEEGDIDINKPCKTCGICTDYRHLHDPFPDEESSIDEAYTIITSDELTSLKEAKNSPDWPEWE